MPDSYPPHQPQASKLQEYPLSIRRLKIEADGDSWRGLIKPKIRLTGNWLERAGFKPGQQVEVHCLASGIIELRAQLAKSSPEPTSR